MVLMDSTSINCMVTCASCVHWCTSIGSGQSTCWSPIIKNFLHKSPITKNDYWSVTNHQLLYHHCIALLKQSPSYKWAITNHQQLKRIDHQSPTIIKMGWLPVTRTMSLREVASLLKIVYILFYILLYIRTQFNNFKIVHTFTKNGQKCMILKYI